MRYRGAAERLLFVHPEPNLDDFNGRVLVQDMVKGYYSKGSRFVVLLPAASAVPRTGAEACSG